MSMLIYSLNNKQSRHLGGIAYLLIVENIADSDSFYLEDLCHNVSDVSLDNHFLLVLDVDAGGIRGFDAAALQVDEVVG